MITLIFVISIIVFCVCLYNDEFIGMLVSSLVGIFSFLTLASLLLFFPYNVEEKIEMYTEENQKIEEKIKETVQAYMEFEQETYKSLIEDAHLETLLIKYPELNSNKLVESQIDVYMDNSKSLKKLKEKKIKKKAMGWWLYFNIGANDK